MTTGTSSRCFSTSILCLWLVTAGCASSDSYSDNEPQMSQRMNGGGRMTGGGMGPGGGPGGPSPQFDGDEQPMQRELPEEAFTACRDEEEGTEVLLTLTNGAIVEATCKVVDDHLVAVPDNEANREMRTGQ